MILVTSFSNLYFIEGLAEKKKFLACMFYVFFLLSLQDKNCIKCKVKTVQRLPIAFAGGSIIVRP